MRLLRTLRAVPNNEAFKQKVASAIESPGENEGRWMAIAGFFVGFAGVLKITGNLSRRFFAELILKPSDVQAIESPQATPTVIAVPSAIPVHLVPQPLPSKQSEHPHNEMSRTIGGPNAAGNNKAEK